MKQHWNRIVDVLQRHHRYTQKMQDTIAFNNSFILYRSIIILEILLVAYGLWAYNAFQNKILNLFYLLFIALNTLLMIGFRNMKTISVRQTKIGCILFLVIAFAFTICISVFPFPDRPAIFFSPIYILLLMLFELPIKQIAGIFSGMNLIYIWLCLRTKSLYACAYDITAAVTVWLLGFFVVYILSSLRLRNGEAKMELEYLSKTDYLTGLSNKREMESFVNKAYQEAIHLQHPIAVIMIDIDFFKQFNDRYGHVAGDECLAKIGNNIQQFAVNLNFLAVRYGGEEFALIMPDCDALKTEELIKKLLQILVLQNPDGETITFSIGAACEIPTNESNFDLLLKRADQALYHAKSEGRNRYMFG